MIDDPKSSRSTAISSHRRSVLRRPLNWPWRRGVGWLIEPTRANDGLCDDKAGPGYNLTVSKPLKMRSLSCESIGRYLRRMNFVQMVRARLRCSGPRPGPRARRRTETEPNCRYILADSISSALRYQYTHSSLRSASVKKLHSKETNRTNIESA